MREITVFGRPGCHLCEQAVEEIEPLCRAAGVALRVADVDADPALRERYGPRIPVVCGDGREICAWPLDRPRIREWLRAGRAP
jgi:thioredoxin reductase (NADPH)